MHARGPAQEAIAASDDPRGAAPVAVLRPLAQVAAGRGLIPLADKLGELRAWLDDDLSTMEAAIQSLTLAQARGSGTERAAQHLLGLPGKRIRPLCVLLAARLGQADRADVRAIATACELVHAATLLHDDVVDHSPERRGAPAAHVLFGNSASILAGDHLLVHAMSLVQQSGAPALLAPLLEVMRRMVEAEAMQLERRGAFVPSREAYLEVIGGKTAALFGWGLYAGACLARLPEADCRAFERMGVHLGTAFQLVDDVLDLVGDSAAMGKSALQDVREGKLTWPLILAAERDASVLGALQRAAAHEGVLPAEAKQDLLQRIEASGAVADARAFAKSEARAASQVLAGLPAGRAKDALALVVDAAVWRIR